MSDSPRQTHRSFTVRVPMSRYLQLADLAQKDNTNLNVKVNELLILGMDRAVDVDKAIASFVKRAIIDQKTKDIKDA